MSALPFSTQLCKEINLLRENPAAYVTFLEQRRARFVDVDEFIYNTSDGNKVKTKEGIIAVEETIAVLSKTPPLQPIQPCRELESAALDHAVDMEVNAVLDHTGSDESTVSTRIRKYGQWDIKIGENIWFEEEEPREIVIAWLIDDGNPSRGQRLNILQDDFKLMGGAISGHIAHTMCCVCTFAHSFLSPHVKPRPSDEPAAALFTNHKSSLPSPPKLVHATRLPPVLQSVRTLTGTPPGPPGHTMVSPTPRTVHRGPPMATKKVPTGQ